MNAVEQLIEKRSASGQLSDCAFIVLTRAPVAGNTKTRLMPALAGGQCAAFHEAMLRDLADVCEALQHQGASVCVLVTPWSGADAVRDMFEAAGRGNDCGRDAHAIQFGPQAEGDLGARMHEAIAAALAEGFTRVVLVGADCPQMSTAVANDAFAALQTSDVALGPTDDGGYYLVGMNAPHKQVFEVEGYGGSDVLARTLAAASAAGLSVHELQVLQDVDTLFDLQCLHGKRNMLPKHCAAALHALQQAGVPVSEQSISIVVPVYNEASVLDALVANLLPFAAEADIVFVDGGSTDGSFDALKKSSLAAMSRMVQTEKGRGHQLNVGASLARGSILLFLHADSALPKDALSEVRSVMKTHAWGSFGISFPSKKPPMLSCRVWSNFRAKYRQTPYGDQGIFLTRDLFNDVGGFPEIPLMEDYQLSLTLRARGLRPGLCKHRILTSDRRFPQTMRGQVKLMCKMANLRKRYRAGESPELLLQEYKDAR